MSESSLIRPLIITEGKTDWMHLKAALASLREAGNYHDLHFDFLEYEDDMGDGELLKICQSASRFPQCRPLICIFDRDNRKVIRRVEGTDSPVKHWGYHVYSFALPVPDHRQGEQSAVSIELYYADDEIKRYDEAGRRLFMSNEFDGETGRHVERDFNCVELHKLQSTTCVIDRKVFNRDGCNCALSKIGFARNVLNQVDDFRDFDFSRFREVFDIINEVVVSISTTALAAESLTTYTRLPLTIPFRHLPESGNRYHVLQIEDVSHGTAKRYSADLLVNETLDKHEIRQIVRAETEILKVKEIYRNEQTESRWRGKRAHVVWLFLFSSREDFADYNPFCRSQWIDDELSSRSSPTRLKGDDAIDNIVIDWSKDYSAKKNLYDNFHVSRDDYLDQASDILASLTHVVLQAIALTKRMEADEMTYDDYLAQMKQIEPEITALDERASNIGVPPPELKPFTEAFRSMVGYAYNITLPFSERGRTTWQKRNRQLLVNQAIRYYLREQKHVETELQKLYGKN